VEFFGCTSVTGTTALVAQVNILNAGTMAFANTAGINGVDGNVDDGAFTTENGGTTTIESGGTVMFQNRFNTIASGGEMDVDGTTMQLDNSQTVSGILYVDGFSDFRTADSLNLNNSGAWLKLVPGSKVHVNTGNGGGTLDISHGNIVLEEASASDNTATITGNVAMDNSDSKIIVGYNDSTGGSTDYTAALIVNGDVTETSGEIDILLEGWMAIGVGGGGAGKGFAEAQLNVSGKLTASGALLVAYSGLPNPAHNQSFEVVKFGSEVGTWAGGVTLPDTTNWTGAWWSPFFDYYLVTYTGS
jgi:hypothetical protein